MKKDFTSSLSNGIQSKQQQNLQADNLKLKNKLNESELLLKAKEEKIKELKNVLAQEENLEASKEKLKLSEVKIFKNIREIDKEDNKFLDLKNSIERYGQLQPVLLSSDGFLLAGHRRYFALKELKKEFIFVAFYEKKLDEIKDILEVIQFEENETRQNLDNFEISNIFNSYLQNGYKQKDIANLFNKKKEYISSILKIKEIDNSLKVYIEEFQKFGVSKKKFESIKEPDSHTFLNKVKSVNIGWQQLYKISVGKTLKEQQKTFLSAFKNRLTEEEISSFIEENKEEKPTNKDLIFVEKTLKYIDSIQELLEKSMLIANKKKIKTLLDGLSAEIKKIKTK